MNDKDDKKPKPEEAGQHSGDQAAARKDAAGDANASATSDQEVVGVVAAGGAVPVTEVDADTKSDTGKDAADDDAEMNAASDEMLTGADTLTGGQGAVPPPPPQSPSDAAKPPRRRADGGARFLALVAMLLALAIGATTILPQITGGSASQIAALRTEIATLADQNRALAAKVAAVPVGEVTDLSAVEARLDALEAAAATAASLQDRLAALEADQGAAQGLAMLQPTVTEADIADLRAEIAALATTMREDRESGVAVAAPVPTASDNAGAEALASELGELEQRLSAVEEGAGSAGATTRDLRASLDALRASLDALRDRMAVLASETDALSSRIETVAETSSQQQGQADADATQKAALVLALGRLRDVATTGSAFPGAWNSVVELGVDPVGHAAIADAAQHGVATVDDLRQRFSAVADAALTAERIGGDETWYGAAFQRLGNLVSVRRVGEVEGTGVEAVVTRAEYRLQEGNLEAALAELDGLTGPPAEAVAAWRATATARLELERAIRALQQGVFQNMTQGN